MVANIPIIATTTNNSIKVNPFGFIQGSISQDNL